MGFPPRGWGGTGLGRHLSGTVGRVLSDIHTRREGSWDVVMVGGDVDLSTTPRLRQVLVGLASGDGPGVLVDLEGCTFIDSSGIGVLVGAVRRLRGADRELRLASCPQPVLELIELCELDRTLPCFPTVAEAAAARPRLSAAGPASGQDSRAPVPGASVPGI